MGESFSGSVAVDRILKMLKAHLDEHSSTLLQAFHEMDVDRSQQLTIEEFGACLRKVNITLPPHQLEALVARFDANGDGTVSIPEFTTFMAGRKDDFERLKGAAAVEDQAGFVSKSPSLPRMQSNYHGTLQRFSGSADKLDTGGMNLTAIEFLTRMQDDVDQRRKTTFINELKKDPRFKPSMLEPPKPKFQTVTIDGTGPIIKTVKANRTGLEPKRPYKWGECRARPPNPVTCHRPT